MEILVPCSKCHGENDRLPQRYCSKCHAAWMRENRPKYHQLSDEHKKRDNARSYAGVYKRRGKIKQQPCQNCGSEDSQMHHPDYDQPLLIEWYCRSCHLELHRFDLL